MKDLILSAGAFLVFLAYIPLQEERSTWARVLRIVLGGLIGGLLGALVGGALKALQ